MLYIGFASGSMMEIAKSGRYTRRVVRMQEYYAPGFVYSIVLLAGLKGHEQFQSEQSVQFIYVLNIHQRSLNMKTRFPVHLSARSSPHRHLHHLPRRVWQSSRWMFWRFSWLLLLL